MLLNKLLQKADLLLLCHLLGPSAIKFLFYLYKIVKNRINDTATIMNENVFYKVKEPQKWKKTNSRIFWWPPITNIFNDVFSHFCVWKNSMRNKKTSPACNLFPPEDFPLLSIKHSIIQASDSRFWIKMKHGNVSMDEISLFTFFCHFLLMHGKCEALKVCILKH